MPTTSELPELIAQELRRARAERTAIAPFSEQYGELDLVAGYAAQRLQRPAEPLLGWKLAMTSHAEQRQVGVDHPVHGFLGPEHVLDVGQPLVTALHIQPRCTPGIVFVMGRELGGAHVTTADVIGACSGVAVGIEVLDSRYRNYRFTIPDAAADNASAARFVVGTPVPVAGIDLRLVGVVFEKNGEVIATASGAATLGHPGAAVAWLVRTLATDGEALHAGDMVLSGGLTAAVPVTGGDVVVATVDRLGTLELACR